MIFSVANYIDHLNIIGAVLDSSQQLFLMRCKATSSVLKDPTFPKLTNIGAVQLSLFAAIMRSLVFLKI